MNIYKKLFNIQQELKAPKNLYNKFGNYNYRSTETIIEAAKPLLKSNSLILLINDEVQEIGGKNYIKATAKLVDIETGESIENSALAREDEDRKKMDSPQITGSCSSYARKYALNGLFCIDDIKDSDATNKHGKDEGKSILQEIKEEKEFAGPESEKHNVKNIWTKKPSETTKQEEDKVISFNQSSQDPITKTEMMFIYSRGFQAGYSQDQVKNHIIKKFNKTIDQLTKVEATKIVEGYQSKILKKMEG
ncbi:ERF family protein [Intestinibacter bartlettii]|uniref:ERF family protein n=1 Tax=Intestinibacter bartlettii TaxID=261299 RepID=A0ABS6E077_9FIRM|nr:ERF family protein [Intestinibacter bartlettii]MBU5337507.1 ERF family protein [Intestinibacter bartlettii]